MTRFLSSRSGLLTLLVLLSGGGAGLVCGLLSCTGGNPTPGAVIGPMVSGNRPPTLTITEPFEDLSVGQGSTFVIRWTDSDPDSNARISFELVDIVNPARIVPLVEGLEENDLNANMQPTPETFLASTGVVTPGSYHVRGTIRDGINAPVATFATIELSETARVELTVTEPGFQPPSRPPTVVVTAPGFNLSVAQDDELLISVQPTLNAPAEEFPYDTDSDATLYILVDVDEDPTNDNPTDPDPNEIILLAEQEVLEGDFEAIDFTETVDLAVIPIRTDGRPYFVRATIQDPTNDPVHAYASGTINVAQAASGTVDLGLMGKTLLGVTFQGFNPGSNLGSRMITARDFDADGVEDFILVARFGNPRNFGNIGEAYLIYGLDEVRFGGSINVNSTSTDISGTIFEAPPVRFADEDLIGIVSDPRTEGITDVGTVGDLNNDGRPELLFGLPHVDGIYQGRDDDPGDDPPEPDATVQIELTLRQGYRLLEVGDDETEGTYSGFEDTFIDSARPNSNFGGESDLEWDNDGVGERIWTLIRIRDLLNEIPDEPVNITNLRATLTVRVVNTGDDGTVHECFTKFTESSVTFNNFAKGGDEPQEGEPDDEDVDYDEEELGSFSGNQVGTTDVDVTELIQKLIDNQLTDVDNEVLLIVVPDEGGDDNTRVRSSEFSGIQEDRPTLTITYDRQRFYGAFGCYPDRWVNNFADEDEGDFDPDFSVEALGFVALIDSDIRDNEGEINLDRLEATVVSLELAGQQAVNTRFDISSEQRAQSPDEGGRIGGARLQVGWYDWVDHLLLNQPPVEALFGWNVDSMPDLNNDQLDEIIISAPMNEQDIYDLEEGGYYPFSTHLSSRGFEGSLIVLPGTDYDTTTTGPCDGSWRDKNENEDGNATIPLQCNSAGGSCSVQNPELRGGPGIPLDSFEIFAEDREDFLGGGRYAGDFNLDGVPDIMAGAPFNDLNDPDEDTREGASYVIYGRVPVGDYDLSLADNPLDRPPMLRVRGETPGDRIGWRQELLGDVNGDRIADIVISSPSVDFGDAARPSCAGDFDGDGDVDSDDLSNANFDPCLGREVFTDDECKVFDYDNDRVITEDDRAVLECLREEAGGCCPVDNGFVGVIFGGVTIDGDREISQVATSDLPGTIFFGTLPGDRAGADVSSAGDFNLDGFDDLLIAAPGERRVDANGQTRLGVVYLIFGGPHLTNGSFNLALGGTDDLPGIVFLSPYAEGRPDEAPPDHVGFLGDINNDGFTDIAIGNTRADFIDVTLPQEPAEPGTVPGTGRRPDAGDVYIVYGNNFGSNR